MGRREAFTDDPATTPYQLVVGSRGGLADLSVVRTRWHQAATPPATVSQWPRTRWWHVLEGPVAGRSEHPLVTTPTLDAHVRKQPGAHPAAVDERVVRGIEAEKGVEVPQSPIGIVFRIAQARQLWFQSSLVAGCGAVLEAYALITHGLRPQAKNFLLLNTSWHHCALRTSVDNSQRTTESTGPRNRALTDDGRCGGQQWEVRP
ncbi:hypothetical protein [Streptomyces coeruleorubidus]|uniref:hypothetical protein n=1 Tax=Streptomyces coeruleorubidus TaxID=116188 RepID=UPI003797AD38